jgi:UDP-N-acetylmuramate-alanine ligase
MEEKKNNFELYLVGGIVGAVIGVIAAMLIEKSANLEGSDPRLSGKKLSRLGFGAVSALWSLIEPGKGFPR